MVATASDPFEKNFRKWYQEYSTKAQINADPDDPKHFYDYRSWYRAQQKDPKKYAPVIDPGDLRFHAPDEFKLKGHPNPPKED